MPLRWEKGLHQRGFSGQKGRAHNRTMVIIAVRQTKSVNKAKSRRAGVYEPLEVMLLTVLHGVHLLLGGLDLHLVATHTGRLDLVKEEKFKKEVGVLKGEKKGWLRKVYRYKWLQC